MNFSKLDAFMETMTARGIPGCELAVTKDGETVYRKCVGYADLAKTRPVSPRDLYWIFSATKVITCLAAMRLVEEGRLDLKDPVSKYIPEYADLKILNKDRTLRPAQASMTVEHLFTMTGGMNYNRKAPSLLEAITPNASTLDLVRAMAKEPLAFEPGTHYQYSFCHDVLAAVVEVITGMRFSTYLEELFFKPLGLRNIGFRPNEEQRTRFADMYGFLPGTERAVPRPCENAFCLSSQYDSGGAGLFSSVDDYTRIISVIACGGATEDGYRILKPETIRMLQENRLCDDALNDFVTTRLYGYGWGLCGRVHINPVTSLSLSPVGEFGWDGAAGAFVMIDPENRVALYFGIHIHGYRYGYHVIHPTLRDLVYEGLATKA